MKYEKLFVFILFALAVGGVILVEPYLLIASCAGFILLTILSSRKHSK
jgi:hypothetical protein